MTWIRPACDAPKTREAAFRTDSRRSPESGVSAGSRAKSSSAVTARGGVVFAIARNSRPMRLASTAATRGS